MYRSLKVYIVESDTELLEGQMLHLYDQGYTDVTGFETCEQMLEHLRYDPDVIMLGDGKFSSGYEVIERVKQYDPQIFVVFVNNKRKFKLAAQMLKIGQFNSLLKKVPIVREKMDYTTYKRNMLSLALNMAVSI